ncbi:phosphatase PAP2 family protein [Streptacidiphilus sp. PB12-B1b]|nr:phosphatase PAP2 family protein [Streptacidiphilus sp. PB12-B1b]
MMFKPYQHWPGIQQFMNIYVIAGQRGPSAIVVSAWLTWRCWRTRSWRPLLALGVALVLLNMSVGAVKIGMGRLGPHYAHVAGSSELFLGGGIFPSGHTANAVVTWGILAYLASRWRRFGGVVAGFMGVTIGLTTLYLGTHWVSDVLAGWAAGALVLLALPLFEPVIVSADERMQAAWADRQALAARLRAFRPADLFRPSDLFGATAGPVAPGRKAPVAAPARAVAAAPVPRPARAATAAPAAGKGTRPAVVRGAAPAGATRVPRPAGATGARATAGRAGKPPRG